MKKINIYINSLNKINDDFLYKLEKKAINNKIPIISQEIQEFIKILLNIKRPNFILEIGSAIGFSALFMNKYSPKKCKIITIDNYKKHVNIARKNFKKAKKDKEIFIIYGNANKILSVLNGYFDFIFIDAAKTQYINFLPNVLRLLNPGGIILSDNIMQHNNLLQSYYDIQHKKRNIHKYMRRYVYKLKNIKNLKTFILQIGDGITVSIKNT